MTKDSVDLEAHALCEDKVRDLWDDGERDIQKIARKASLSVPEARRILIEGGRTTWEGEYAPSRISEVGAKDLHDTLLFRAEILSIEGGLSLPSQVRGECMRCTEGEPVEVNVDPLEFLFLTPAERKAHLELKGLQAAETIGCKHTGSRTKVRVSEAEAVDYSILTVGNIPEEMRSAESFQDIRRKLHLIGTRPPLGGCAKFIGTVESDPRTGELLIISEEFQELESLPVAAKLDDRMRRKLREIGRMPLETLRSQIAPDMVGRPLVQESRLLVLASPLRIRDVERQEIRGNLIEVLLGDTSTDKSVSAGDTAKAQSFGAFVQAENAARTGLTYNITEPRTGGFVLTWGLLPRNHGKYVVIDGLEKWGPELMVQLRGVLRDQEVQVDRVVHGRRPAAVRMTITLNPEKPVREYPFRCAAILGTKAFVKGPDIARVDLWHVFAKEDVSGKEIAHRVSVKRPVDEKLFRTLIYWIWSRSLGQVKWAPDVAELVKKEAAAVMDDYSCAGLPVVHSGFRDTLSRVACAFAALRFSTTDGEDLLVLKEHVVEAVAWLRRMYDTLELHEYKETAEEERVWTGGEFLSAAIEIGEPGLRIVSILTGGPLSAKDLAERLGGERAGWTENAVQHRYDELKKWGLIETRPGLGAVLTLRGVKFFRRIRSEEGRDVAEFGDNEIVVAKIGEDKSPLTHARARVPISQTSPPSSSPEALPSTSSLPGKSEAPREEAPDERKDEGGPQP